MKNIKNENKGIPTLEVLVKRCISACAEIENPKRAAALAWGFQEEYCSYGCKYSYLGICPKKLGHVCFMEEHTSDVCEIIADREEIHK